MGVYERDWVEDAEKESAAAINGVDVNYYTKKVGTAIYNYIEDNFNNVKITKAKSAITTGENEIWVVTVSAQIERHT